MRCDETRIGWSTGPWRLLSLGIAFSIGLQFGCSANGGGGLPRYRLSDAAYTTLQAIWAPIAPSPQNQADMDAGLLTVYDGSRAAEAGLGVRLEAGNPWRELTDLGAGFNQPAVAQRRSLAWILEIADPQLIDEESPIRFETFATLYRPHGHLLAQVLDSHVRSAERIAARAGRPFDFAVLAGDLADGSQRNELSWTMTALVGGPIDPDSGRDDDPEPGPGNDYNDPFLAKGLSVPWYATIGNHEATYNGGFGHITDELRQAAVGEQVYNYDIFPNGFCDGSTPWADVRTAGPTPPDPERVPQRREEVLALIAEAGGLPAGHGLTADNLSAGHAYYSAQPLPGKPIRLIALDTVNSAAEGIGRGSQGWCDQQQLTWLEGELAAADAADELVVVFSHHRTVDFNSDSPVSGEALSATLAAAEGVVVHLTGHGHGNTAFAFPDPSGENPQHGYWELMAAAPADFAMQSRMVEIVDEGNGFVSIYTTNLEHNAPEDSLAHLARQLSGFKLAFGTATHGPDIEGYWEEDLRWQNLLLRVAIPDAVAQNLAAHAWPDRIESEETLLHLDGP